MQVRVRRLANGQWIGEVKKYFFSRWKAIHKNGGVSLLCSPASQFYSGSWCVNESEATCVLIDYLSAFGTWYLKFNLNKITVMEKAWNIQTEDEVIGEMIINENIPAGKARLFLSMVTKTPELITLIHKVHDQCVREKVIPIENSNHPLESWFFQAQKVLKDL